MIETVLHEFDLTQIADSGQCFRMHRLGDNHYYLIAFGQLLEVAQEGETVRFYCQEEAFFSLWADYFDLNTDYAAFRSRIPQEDVFLNRAVQYGKGIRILRQDLWETLVTFILSQRKSIPAIRRCVEALCQRYGDPGAARLSGGEPLTFYSFPSPAALSRASLDDLRELGLGYRDKYVLQAAADVAEGRFSLEGLRELSCQEACKALTSLYGVGVKVANCVLLFALYHIDAFPRDVWINRIIDREYQGKFDVSRYSGYAGVIQQYMFYYARSREYAERMG